MALYRFNTGQGSWIEVEASDIDEALDKAGITSYEFCEIYEDDASRRIRLLSAIADEILFGE